MERITGIRHKFNKNSWRIVVLNSKPFVVLVLLFLFAFGNYQVFAQKEKKSEIVGVWFAEGNQTEGDKVHNEYFYFDNGKMYYLSNIEQHGLQISDPFSTIKAGVFEYSFSNGMLRTNNVQNKAKIENGYLEVDMGDGNILKIKKINTEKNINGTWMLYIDEAYYFIYTISNNKTCKITDSYGETNMTVAISFERIEINNIVFDGKIDNSFFLLAGDRLIVMDYQKGYLIPSILIKKSKTK